MEDENKHHYDLFTIVGVDLLRMSLPSQIPLCAGEKVQALFNSWEGKRNDGIKKRMEKKRKVNNFTFKKLADNRFPC
jgi:hypothetical protein